MIRIHRLTAIVPATIAVVCAVSVAIPAFGQVVRTPPTNSTGVRELRSGPRIEFDETTHDFGIVDDLKILRHEFVFWNRGDAELIIDDVRASGTGSYAFDPIHVAPGERGVIHATLQPRGRTGHQAKSIRVASNDSTNLVVNLRVSADIFAAVNVEPKVFRFDQVEAGHAKTISGEVRMRGEDNKVTDVEVDGPYASAKILGTETIEVAGVAATLTKLEITVHEDAPLGWMDRNVTIRTSNPEVPAVNAPLWANVIDKIEVQPPKLPLGVVRSGKPFQRELRLVSKTGEPFELIRWECDANMEGLDLQLKPRSALSDDASGALVIAVSGIGPEATGKLEGKIVLTTSLDDNVRINVPFHCVVHPPK